MIALAPDPTALAALLDAHAPLTPSPLATEILTFQARGLVDIWEAAERLVGETLPSPFWAFAWPGGAALARVLLDRPELARGRRVLDVGAGGGVAALAAARAGARHVVANDVDEWALATAGLAAERQGLRLETLLADLTRDPEAAADFELVLCGDVGYERTVAPRVRALLDRAREGGAEVLAADPGRAYFDPTGLQELARFTLAVPLDLEGVAERTAVVYRWP